MAEQDWICENCLAQNSQSDTVCRVCGLPHQGAAPAPVEEKAEKGHRKAGAPEGKAGDAGSTEEERRVLLIRPAKRRLARAIYCLLTALWALVLLETCAVLAFGTPAWELKAISLPAISSESIRDFVPNGLELLRQCGERVTQITPAALGEAFRYLFSATTSSQPFGEAAMVFLSDLNGLCALLVALWTLRLPVRAASRSGRAPKARHTTFFWLGLENIVLSLLGLFARAALWTAPEAMVLAEEARRVAATFTLSACGIALATAVLILSDFFRREYPAGQGKTAYNARRYRADGLHGLLALVIFALLAVFFTAGTF